MNRRRFAVALAAVVLGAGSGGATAAFTATAASGAGSFSAAGAPVPDTTPPTVGGSTVLREQASPLVVPATGRFRQNGGYRVYARASDDRGASGLTVTANAATIGGGTTTTPLSSTGGPWVVGGTTYEYRTAVLTAGDVTSAATTRTYTVRATDAASNTAVSGTRSAVSETYAQVVAATSSLVAHYPLQSSSGTTSYGSDTFTGATTDLVTHTSSTGTTWTADPGDTASARITSAGRARQVGVGYGFYRSSIRPPTPDYVVEANIYVASVLDSSVFGIMGRFDGTSYYTAMYDEAATRWQILRCTNGVSCQQVGTPYTQVLTQGATYRLGLSLIGTRMSLTVNGVTRVTGVNGTHTAAESVGIRFGGPTAAAPSDTTGLHITDLDVRSIPTTAPLSGSQGTAGTVTGGAAFGSAGAIADDPGDSLALDGVDDSVRLPRTAGNGYLVQDDFTLEAWFRSSAGAGTTWASSKGILDATGPTAATTRDFGMGLNAAGRVTTGVGGTGGAYTASTTDSGTTPTWTDGAWHHVVMSRTKSTGVVVLHVDGVQRGAVAGTTASLTTAGVLVMGANAVTAATGLHLAGGLDEVALYSTAFDAAAALDHYRAGRGTG